MWGFSKKKHYQNPYQISRIQWKVVFLVAQISKPIASRPQEISQEEKTQEGQSGEWRKQFLLQQVWLLDMHGLTLKQSRFGVQLALTLLIDM